MIQFSIRLMVVSALLGGLGFYWLQTTAKGKPDEKNPVVSKHEAEALGTVHCIGCHAGYCSSDGNSTKTEALIRYEKLQITKFIRLDEYTIWHKRDIHARAFENLIPKSQDDQGREENIAAKMERNLGEGPLAKNKACLACHANIALLRTEPKKSNLDEILREGVSCESCHGAASEWLGAHVNQDKWRKLNPDLKSAEGLVDLRDPQKRAETCASCHIGNLSEGKFVTHRMFAAGHPPLPSFELTRYLEDQPRHAYRSEKNEELSKLSSLDSDGTWKKFHYRKESTELSEIRVFAIGTVVAFRESVKLLMDEANEKKHEGQKFDFSYLNCYSCHHELKIPSDRQKAGYPITPGRPVIRPLSKEFFEAVARHAKRKDPKAAQAIGEEIRTKILEFQKGFDVPPFGNRLLLAKKGKELLDLSQVVLEDLNIEKTTYNDTETKELFAALKQVVYDRLASSNEYLDYDTAQQLVWGLETIRNQLSKVDSRYQGKDPKAIKGAFKDLLDPELKVDGMEINARESIENGNDYRKRLNRIENFNSERFRSALDVYFQSLP